MSSKRIFDLALALSLCVPALVICLVCAPFIFRETRANPLFRQRRVGQNNVPFDILKLRTMRSDTRDMASHEILRSQITPLGSRLRRFKVDELPQIWNVLVGSMSFVGPRPCLPTQTELIEARRRHGVLALLPGITGPAQIAGLDMSDPARLAVADAIYVRPWSFRGDLKLLYRTLIGKGRGDAALGASVAELPPVGIERPPLPSEATPNIVAASHTAERVVVTGASGFLGRAIVADFASSGWQVDAIVRSNSRVLPPSVVQHCVDDLAAADPDQLAAIMGGASCVIHLAALVPGKRHAPSAPTTAEMAESVAVAASRAGVDRLIVMSSAYAALAETGSPNARSYGHEKLEAERRIRAMRGSAPTIFLRPPVIYGSGMSGSLATLTNFALKEFPIPLGRANNARFYLSRINLVALVRVLAGAPALAWAAANGRTYIPTDRVPVSTANLVRLIAKSHGKRANLLPVPLFLLKFVGRITGKSEMLSGAIDSFDLSDNAALLADFHWQPSDKFPESLSGLVG